MPEEKQEFKYFLDLFTVSEPGMPGATFFAIEVTEREFKQLSDQIAEGKTKFVTKKPDSNLPQVWIVSPPIFSASVRKWKVPSGLIIPDSVKSGIHIPGKH